MTTHTKTLAALALAGAVTLSPMLALADDSVGVNVSANASTSGDHSLYQDIRLRLEGRASTTASTSEERQQERQQKQQENQQNRIAKEQDHGNHLVDVRISTLQNLEARINDMTRLTADQKNAIIADLTAQINALTSLRTQIASSTSTTTLIADLKSIAPDYRTYLLVLPRTAIVAAANRVMNITDQMTAEGAKLQARITAAQTAGVNVSSAQSAYADYTAKVADAKVQAQAALNLVVNLNADNGNAGTLAANTAALKSARTKLQAARTDLREARQDMNEIMQVIRGKGEVTATTTASTTHS